jgi:diguanylate cyclase (GGDEF)-like protein
MGYIAAHMRIRTLLSVVVPVSLGGVLAAGGLVAAAAAQREAFDALLGRNRGAMEVVALAIGAALGENDAVALDGLVSAWTHTDAASGLRSVEVLDAQGRIVAHSDPTQFGMLSDDAFAWRALGSDGPTWQLRADELRMAVPARAGLRWGTVVATYDAAPVRALGRRRALGWALGSVGGAAALAVFLAWSLGRAVVRPVGALRDAALHVGEGRFDARLPDGGATEIRELAAVFGRMAEALRLRHEDLEARVAARTADLEAANTRLARLSVEDGLTGLLNHRGFQDALAQAIAREARGEPAPALLVLDVDHFKRFNDTVGHPAGDAMLRTVAEVLRGAVRAVDACARHGGEEFAVVLPATGRDEAAQVAERIRAAMEVAGAASDHAPAVTVSIGVAGGGGLAREALFDAADRALYRAKSEGRNRVSLAGEPP